MSRDDLRNLLKRANVNSAVAAYERLQQLAPLLGFVWPDGLDLTTFSHLYDELMASVPANEDADFLATSEPLQQ